jgi:hypothetical protein
VLDDYGLARRIRWQPPHLVDDLLDCRFTRGCVNLNRYRRPNIGAIEQIVGGCKPERCGLVLVHERVQSPQCHVAVLARRFVKRHPLSRRRNQRQRSTSFWATSAATFETDGNLTCRNSDMAVEFHWQGKFRGPDFAPMNFLLKTVTHERLKTTKGRLIPTVIASHLSDIAHQ